MAKIENTEDYIRLLSQHESRFRTYVLGMIPNQADAQDILQEGKIIMWREFEKFEPGTNFAAWGRRIMFYQVLSHRRKAKRQKTTWLSEESLELLHEEVESGDKEKKWIRREKALDTCLEQIPENNREIMIMRYRDEASIERIAHQTDRTEAAIYRLLSRLRKRITLCVDASLNPQVS